MKRIILTLLLALNCCLIEASSYRYNLVVMTIFQDEAPYLREWIEYHKLIGVEHFYLYNNLSSDNYREVLSPYVANGQVTLVEWPYLANNVAEWDPIQINAYNDGLKTAKIQTEWLAIIDADEFLVPVKYDSFTKLLASYKKRKSIGGICLPWVFFGTSYVEKIPYNKLMIETLIMNSGPVANGDANKVFKMGAYKSVVRTKYVTSIPSPHFCTYEKGKSHEMIPVTEGQINHYWTRDAFYLYNFKIPRREQWGHDKQTVIDMANAMNKDTPTYSHPILRFVPSLRKQLYH